MSRRRKKKLHPAFAVVMLLAGVFVAGRAFISLSGGAARAPAGDVEIVEVPETDSGSGARDEVAAIEWQDLLARHGSFDGTTPVRVAFSVLEEVRQSMPAPGGETAGGTTYWEGPDPPELRLGVVMISARSRRAVLGGSVIGIGEEIAGVVVQRIARDRVVTLWDSRVLTYDLENGWPREFRAELERRRREADVRPEDAGGAAPVDPGNASWQEKQR